MSGKSLLQLTLRRLCAAAALCWLTLLLRARQVEAQIDHCVKPYREACKLQPSTATAIPSTCVLEVCMYGEVFFSVSLHLPSWTPCRRC